MMRWLTVLLLGAVLAGCADKRKTLPPADPPPPSTSVSSARVDHGTLETVSGVRILTLEGTPEQMGRAAGRFLRGDIRRVVRDMIADGVGAEAEAYANILRGGGVMEAHQHDDFRREVRAMAEAAGVKVDDLMLLQYFGDVRRCIEGPGSSAMCTSFAMMPPLTKEKTCIVGRNFDYFDHGVGEYASILVHYKPEGKIPFVTVTWAGIVNGWTLMNARGLVVSNDTVFEGDNSLKGQSTCFLLRYVAERARTVDEGIELVKKADRSCGTAMLIASGDEPDAAIVEFDSKSIAVRRAEHGFVGADNGFLKLYRRSTGDYYGRIKTAFDLARRHAGRVMIDTPIAEAEGVPIESMNLHCVTLDAGARTLRVAMGKIPAYRLPFKTFKLTDAGLVESP